MKRFILRGAISLASFFTVLLLIAGCAKKEDEGKVQITAASEEAKQDFLNGRDMFEKLKFQESLPYFQSAIAKDNNFALAYYYHAIANPTTKGFFEDIGKATALADKVSPGEKLMIVAAQSAANGDTKAQEENLTQLANSYPMDARAQTFLGQFYVAQQKYDKAEELLTKATQVDPNFSQAYNMLGYCNKNLGNFDAAEKAFKKYIELIPDDPNPYDSYAELLMKQGNYEKSIEQYQKALSIDPNFVASYNGIASNYCYLGKFDDAKKEFQKIYDMARNDGEKGNALFGMTVVYVSEGNFDKAMEEMQKQYAINEKNNDAGGMAGDFTAMGNILFEQGKYDEAMKKFNESLQTILNSNLSDEVKENAKRFNLYNMARVGLMKNNLKGAKEKSSEFGAQAKSTFQVWLSHELQGMIALKEKNYDKAATEFAMGNMQNPYTIYRLGLAYQGMNKKEMAEEHFKKAANFNELMNLNQAFVSLKSKKMSM